MITTNLLTFEISFLSNGSETFIFNVSNDSVKQLTNILKNNKLYLHKIKQFDRTQSKFKTISKRHFLECIDYYTELTEILK
jgi:hypothetical protein